jgi:hypothetical protein
MDTRWCGRRDWAGAGRQAKPGGGNDREVTGPAGAPLAGTAGHHDLGLCLVTLGRRLGGGRRPGRPDVLTCLTVKRISAVRVR